MAQQKKNQPRPFSNIELGKIPPQATDFEEAVLGAMLIEPKSYYLVSTILCPESFYREEHVKVFSAIEDLSAKHQVIDMLTVTDELRRKGELEEVGGIAYISHLTMHVASSAHIEAHARVVQQKYIARRLIQLATEILQSSYDEGVDISRIIEFIHVELNGIVRNNISKIGRKFDKIGADVLRELSELAKSKQEFNGITSGFSRIDRHTSGWQDGDLILIAARPSMGKTYMALTFARNAFAIQKKRVLIFSLEMTDKQIYQRELSNETGIENARLRKADFTDKDWESIDNAQAKFENYEILIDDTPALTIMDFKAKCLMYQLDFEFDLIVIDYIQLMRSPQYSHDKNREIGDISGNLKAMAKELSVPIIALSQLSRKVEDRSSKRPQLSDLRDSGQLEQDADIVAFIHRPEYYEIKQTEDGSDTKNLIEFILAKHRNGATGTIKLYKTTNWTAISENTLGESSEETNGDYLPF